VKWICGSADQYWRPFGQYEARPRNPAKAETLMSASIHCMDGQSAALALVPAKLAVMIRPPFHVGVNRADVHGVRRWVD
jgi:hypothetical protein